MAEVELQLKAIRAYWDKNRKWKSRALATFWQRLRYRLFPLDEYCDLLHDLRLSEIVYDRIDALLDNLLREAKK